jgi:exopolysaccharide production protein ExoQ
VFDALNSHQDLHRVPSLVMIALSISAVVAGPLAVFAPLGMAPLSTFVVAGSLVAVIRARHRLVGHPAAKVVLLLLAWMLLATAWTFNPLDALSLAVRTGFLIAGGTALSVMLISLESAHKERLARCIIAGFALLVLFLAFELVSGGLLVRTALPERYAQQPWLYVVVSRGSVFMALMMWPTLLAFRALDRRAGTALVCAAAVGIAVLTDHGATRLSVAMGLAVLALVYYFGRPVVVLIGGLCIAVILTAPLLPLGPLSPQSWQVVAEWLKLSAIHRLYIWQFVAERVWERPLFGWGFDASRHMPGRDAMTPIDVPVLSLHPHNTALQIWLELGAVGAVVAALLMAVIVRQIARPDADRFTQAAATAALCASFGVASLSFGIWQSWWLGSLVLMTVWIAALSAANGASERAAAIPARQIFACQISA